jgi:hypothetical protein
MHLAVCYDGLFRTLLFLGDSYKTTLLLNPETFSSCQLIKLEEIQGTSAFQNKAGLLMPDLLQYLGFDK